MEPRVEEAGMRTPHALTSMRIIQGESMVRFEAWNATYVEKIAQVDYGSNLISKL